MDVGSVLDVHFLIHVTEDIILLVAVQESAMHMVIGPQEPQLVSKMYAHVPHLRPMDTPVDVQQAVPLLLTAVILVTSLIHSLFMTPKRLTGELMVIATKELAMMVAGLDMMYHVGNVPVTAHVPNLQTMVIQAPV
jgi:hypothetical protein